MFICISSNFLFYPSFILTMWYVNNITKWMFSKNKEGFRLTMWYVKKKIGRPVVGSPKVLY